MLLRQLRWILVALAFSTTAFAQTQVNQIFLPQGPAPSTGPENTVQSADALPNGTVHGAVEAIVTDPALGANTFFIGTPNGGIWKTTNGGTTWTPLTSNLASLSIASLSVDPTDTSGQTLIAGIGLTSAGTVCSTGACFFTGSGGQRDGLLYTTNGGTTWSQLGGATLAGQTVDSVAARGSVIMAATFEESFFSTPAQRTVGGLYRSTNGGSSFTLVSGTGGLPQGPVTSLVGDPTNSSRFYAAVAAPNLNTNATGLGATSVYVSNDSGATWTLIFSATNSGGTINTTTQTSIKIAAGPNNTVAIGVMNITPVPNPASGCPTCSTLTGLFYSNNAGGTWTSLTVPAVNAGSQQAPINFAIAIDPTSNNIVYVSGDAQTATPFTVQAFRVNATTNTATSLTDQTGVPVNTGNGSTVHADSRALAFDTSGNLLIVSDGGVYERTQPQTTSGVWQNVSGNLSVFQASVVGYDANSKRAVVASQDNGVTVQSAPASPAYNAIQGADGVNVAVNDKTLSGQSAIYSSYYNYGNLSRLVINSSGATVSPTPNPAGIPITCSGGSSCATAVTGSWFGSPFVLNRINPSLIALGGTNAYVSQDTLTGGNAPSATTIDLTLTNVGSTGGNSIVRMAYGTQDNTNVLLVGAVGGVWLSTTSAASSLSQLTAYTGLTPTSLVFDARSQNRFFVADNNALYGTVNQGVTFQNLTANLPATFTNPTSLEFISNNGVNALLVGGLNNVANAQSPITVASSDASGNLSNWQPFGQGLPNSPVNGLVYNPTVDVLTVGTFGSGLYLLYDVTSYFPQATVLQFGLANNNSTPSASFLTDGTDLSGNPFSRPLVKYGPGTLLINGNATYTGTTTINGGTVQLGDGINTGSLLGPGDVITTAGTHINLQPGIAVAGEIVGNISGPGDLTQAGPGIFFLLGTNTYSSGLAGTIITGGTLVLGDGGTSGSITSNVSDGLGGTFAVDRSDTYTYGGQISGLGAFVQAGTGTTILTGTNSYSGGTTIFSGTLQIGNGGTAGSITGNVLDEGMFAIDLSSTPYTFAGNITGLGGFSQIGTGTTVLTGANAYFGPTLVTAGKLQAGAVDTFSPNSANIVSLGAILDLNNLSQIIGSLSGAGNVTLGSATLTTGGDGTSTIFTGAISGTGGLTKQGAGEFFLNGNSNFGGPTNVDAGILSVNGSIVSAVSINAGATLGGTGSVGPTTVNAGGTLAPGPDSAIGTLSVNGALTFNAGSFYSVFVLGGTNDRTNATGAATLTGTVDATFLSTNLSHSYTIVSAAGGRTGTFSTLDSTGLPSFITASLAYTATDADLVIDSHLGQIPGLTQNQAAVGGALDNSFNNGGGTLPGLFGLPASQIPRALNALSGEGFSGTQETAFGAGDLFLSMMMNAGAFWRSDTNSVDMIGTTHSGAMSYAGNMGYAGDMSYAAAKPAPMVLKAISKALAPEPRWRDWFSGFDGTWKITGDPVIGSADLRHRSAGGAGGIDYQINQHLLAGFAIGGADSPFTVNDRATSGMLESAHIGAYGVARWDSYYVASAASFAGIDTNTTRTIATGASPPETATTHFTSELANARLELGATARSGNGSITPFAAVQFAGLWQPHVTETSTVGGAPGVLGLAYASRFTPSLPTFLGAQFDARMPLGNGMVLMPSTRLSWVHEFEPTRDISATFISLPLATFTVDGPRAARDAARVESGGSLQVTQNAFLFGNFLGEFSKTSQMYSGMGGARFAW